MSKQTEALKLALEALKELRMLGMNMQWHDSWLAKSETAITAIREALAEQPAQQHIEHCLWARNGNQPCPHVQPAQQQEPLDKNGSPCAEFWDWLPKAYNFEGAGNFTKYNMEVAFLAGKQSASAQEPVAWADINALTEQFNSVNCGTAYRLPGEGRQPLYTSPPASKPLTDEQKLALCKQFPNRLTFNAIHAVEAAHGIKGDA